MIDGVFDPATRRTLIAFKWEGREITGQLTVAELEAIHSGSQNRDDGYAHAKVDIDRQLLLLVGR